MMNIEDLSRLDMLLADRATGDLEFAEFRELAALTGSNPDADLRTDLAAAALMLALVPEEEEPLPQHLQQSLLAMAPHVNRRSQTHAKSSVESFAEPVPIGRSQSGTLTWMGWLAAAACLVFALWTWQSQRPQPTLDVLAQRAALETQAADKVTLSWTATEDPSAKGASGDVLWSNAKQQGFMRIRGLEANDPGQVQYQLWIFDGTRENPVDGGVFNIPAGQSEVIVPIDAKLLVNQPTLFAVTVEKPGGVVVSKKERIVLVADPGSAG